MGEGWKACLYTLQITLGRTHSLTILLPGRCYTVDSDPLICWRENVRAKRLRVTKYAVKLMIYEMRWEGAEIWALHLHSLQVLS